MHKMRWLAYGSGVITAGVLYATALLVSHVSRAYFYLAIPIVLLALLTKTLFDRVAFLTLRKQLETNWGKEVKRKRDESTIRTFYDSFSQSTQEFLIDDRTFEDLNMDAIFSTMDRTMTAPGQQYLYKLLRTPLFAEEPLKARGHLIRALQRDAKLREELLMLLHRVGYSDGEGLSSLLWNPPILKRPRHMWLYHLMLFVAILSPAVLFVSRPLGFLIVVGVYLLNLSLHTREHKRIFGHFSSIKYISRLIHWTKQMAKIDQPAISLQQGKLRENLATLSQYGRAVSRVDMDTNDLISTISMYTSIFFLAEVRGFYKAIGIIEKQRKQLQELFVVVGELDALQSIASYRVGLRYYCEPKYSRGTTLHVVDAYHPLVDDPVANSVTLTTKGMLVTGSNMSGKSTFLRSMGLNSLLAQTIYTCYARNYQTSFFQLFTSIGRSDNVIQGESYYLVEAKLILRILNALQDEQPTLCIIDEMYRGTNTKERIAASCRVLQYIARHNCLALTATHDVELTELLADVFLNYHFSEKVGSKGLEFDYKLKRGPSTTRNALALLKLLGYPDSVLNAPTREAEMN